MTLSLRHVPAGMLFMVPFPSRKHKCMLNDLRMLLQNLLEIFYHVESVLVRFRNHYIDVIMGAMASQITGVLMVCSTVCSGTDHRKYQSSASLAFMRGMHRWPMNSPHKGPVTRKMFPFDGNTHGFWKKSHLDDLNFLITDQVQGKQFPVLNSLNQSSRN